MEDPILNSLLSTHRKRPLPQVTVPLPIPSLGGEKQYDVISVLNEEGRTL
jgi:hypothetical protein